MELGYINTLQGQLGGFNYDNCLRNTALEAQAKMDSKIKTMKTGTTICGVIFDVSSLQVLTNFRMASRSLQTLAPRVARLWETRTARRSTT